MRLLATQVDDDRAMPAGARITNSHSVDLTSPYCTSHARRVDRHAAPWRRSLTPLGYWKALAYRPYASKVTDGMVLMRFLFRNPRYAREFEDANEAWLAIGAYQLMNPTRMRRRVAQRL
ncbi:MAG: hypothetical protein KJN71_04470 [Acidimicrobiia bacterium]|nr:hypothetical protein [Acidimicrobiia bacterium]